MKTVNSLSGGKTSSYLAVHFPADYEIFSLVCINDSASAPKDKKLIQFVNDKLGEKYIGKYGEFIATAEDDKTLVAMRDLEQLLGREIVWVRGASYDDVIDMPLPNGENPTRLPSWARRYCTDAMKLYPIFMWWFTNLGDKVNMQIGFRYDEYDRMERFFNNSDPTNYSIRVSCSTRGKKLHRLESFNWRFCKFPLIKNGITKKTIDEYWMSNGYLGGNLFEERRQINFPIISNCVGCFHKKPETLCVMWNTNTEKMEWFSKQETKEMGTWLDSRITYAEMGQHALNTPYIEEMVIEVAACDSGGCTD